MATIDLLSPFTPEECVDRLRAGLLNSSSDVDGRVEYDWIRLRKKIFYRNSFQTFLTAKVKPEGSGTRIRGTLGMHPLVTGFMAVWFAGVLAANLFILVPVLKSGDVPPGWFIAPLMPLAGVGMILFGRLLVRGDDKLLIEFVTTALEAEPTAVK